MYSPLSSAKWIHTFMSYVCANIYTQSILPHSEGDARIALASLGLLQDSKKDAKRSSRETHRFERINRCYDNQKIHPIS
ncbi:unnamed protein product [Trichogramma brassicae]|uniref:Uncharacterized protein n=1 Tax=Trichogramma brassicae TaxID=86971 RepID=A0A6H5J5V1_9HYME|nr:unnamed protein product [Trichogramma brassicae]